MASPRGLFRVKMPQNGPKLLKITLLCVLRKTGTLDYDETCYKVETNSMLHNIVHLYSGISLGCALGALLGLKTPLYGLFADVCPKSHYVCCYSVFYGAEFKFTGLNTCKGIVHLFLGCVLLPLGTF